MLKYLFCIALLLFTTSIKANPEYIIQNITVDVSDESALKAQEKAFADAEITAFQGLIQKMVSPSDLSNVPALTPDKIKSLITSFSVQDEQRSDVRYMATLNYQFDSNAVANFLRSNNIVFSERLVQSTLIVPLIESPTEEETQHAWQKVWEQVNLKSYNVPFILVPPTSLPKDITFGSSAALEQLRALGQKYKVLHIAVIKLRLESNPEKMEEPIKAYLDIYPTILQQSEYAIQLPPVSFLPNERFDKFEGMIQQSLSEIEKTHLTQTQQESSAIKETLELVVPTNTLAQWHHNLRLLQAIPNLIIKNIRSISKKTAHIMVQISDINHIMQYFLQKGFHVEPNNGYLILRMPDDAAKSA